MLNPLRRRKSIVFSAFLLIIAARGAAAQNDQSQPTYVLHGTLEGRDNESYRLVPFQVPPGTRRVTVEFAYTGRDNKTVIDLGLFDSERFRGWSGGDKSSFTVSEMDATSSYLAGPLPPGEWRLLLGVPNIRKNVRSEYTARIFLSASPEPQPVVLRDTPGWYQGDLHAHTEHSDGSCLSLAGKKVPCPEFKLAEAAAERKLDFVAFTDHNTVSHYNALAQWQPYFDTLLLVRGREITTFGGHANIYGTSQFVEFRLGSEGRTPNSMLAEAHGLGAVISINHPAAPSAEICMGCGWTWLPKTDFRQVDAIEVVNGPEVETRFSGIPFWQDRLNAGFRVTAIGGSDDHNSGTGRDRKVGIPTTVVYARQLSEPAILEGIRAGHVYLKTQGPDGPTVAFSATSGGQQAMMGDNLAVKASEAIRFLVRVTGAAGGKVEIVRDGALANDYGALIPESGKLRHEFTTQADAARHWYRVSVRAADGKLLALTNPIYVNFEN